MHLGASVIRIGAVVLLVGSACGTVPSTTCGSSNCAGCCASDGSCEAGTTDDQCGDHGFQCVSCADGQKCKAGTCAATDACGGCASGEQCTRDMNGVVACRALCTSNAHCSTGCCAATSGNYSVCAPAPSCDPCGGCPSGQVCLSGQCVTNNACGGCPSNQRCVGDQNGANTACRELCTTGTQCSTGCCSTTSENYSVCGPIEWCCPSLVGATFQTSWQIGPRCESQTTDTYATPLTFISTTTAYLGDDPNQYQCPVTLSGCELTLYCWVFDATVTLTQSQNGTQLTGSGTANTGTGIPNCTTLPVTVTGTR